MGRLPALASNRSEGAGAADTLIKECCRTPFLGIGKPEPLRGAFSGWWSRRITHDHRQIYRPMADNLVVAQCRYHY